MGSIRRRINLLHYNIWRFERWTRYLVFGDNRITTLAHQDDQVLQDSIPFSVAAVDESMLPNSGKHFSVLVYLLLLSIWNIVCAIFGFHLAPTWFWGALAFVILEFVVSSSLIPIPIKVSERNVLLEEFKVFESMSASKKRLSGVFSFLFVIGAYAAFIFSFLFYLRILIAGKPGN